MPRVNQFQNLEVLYKVSSGDFIGGVNGTLPVQGVYIPGSISFNTVAILVSNGNTVGATLSISFGLYSRTGSTLSLANSASASITGTNVAWLSWITLGTSATQDITPGNWWFGYIHSTSGDDEFRIYNHSFAEQIANRVYGGLFVMGASNASRTNLPASIETSALLKYGGSGSGQSAILQPYVIISA